MTQNNFLSNEDALRRKAHLLLSYVLAKYDLDMLNNPIGEYWCPVIDMQEYENEQLHDALISFSALMRVNDDITGGFKAHKENNAEGVGTLNFKETTGPLSLREACNKIIHCTKYEWKLTYSKEHPIYPKYREELYNIENWQQYKKPMLLVEGELYDNPWTAEVNILKYILAFGFSTSH